MPERFLVTYPEKGDFFDSYDAARQFAQQKTVEFPSHTIELWVPVTQFAQQQTASGFPDDAAPPAEDAGIADPLKVAGVVTTPEAAREFDDGA